MLCIIFETPGRYLLRLSVLWLRWYYRFYPALLQSFIVDRMRVTGIAGYLFHSHPCILFYPVNLSQHLLAFTGFAGGHRYIRDYPAAIINRRMLFETWLEPTAMNGSG